MATDWLTQPAAQPYLPAIYNAAAEYNVDPEMLANQIGAESSFNPNAVSSTGAVGIAQILPSTAANPGYGVSPVDPTDPNASINFAAAYTQARGGYTQQGLANYSGGSYSAGTTSNILGTSGPSSANGATDGNGGIAGSSLGMTGGVGDILSTASNAAGSLGGIVGNYLGTNSGSSSWTATVQTFFVRICVAIVGIIIIGVAATYFKTPILTPAVSAARKTAKKAFA